MITPEEVRKELGDKVIFSTIPITMNYLKQQQAKDERAKKVEELLGLYRNSSMETDINYRMHYWQVIDDLEKEVFDIFKDLEKELEELK